MFHPFARFAVGLALAAACAPLFAQAYPVKPIRVILASAPGGVTDSIVNTTGQEFAKRVGQPLVMEHRPGASGIIGWEACAKAPPDGYTLGMLQPGLPSFNPLFYPNLPYDADSFTPIVHLI